MCGIVGVIQYRSPIDREIRARALRVLFSEMMLLTEIRGDDATGLYQVHTDGDWMLAKKGEKSTKWLYEDRASQEDPVVYKDFMDSWTLHPKDLTALVGHCRKATVGSKGQDNDDNHPFAIQLDESNAILGVHNGTLANHEVIFRRLGDELERQGEVDSEAIFHLLYHATDKGTKPVDEKVMQHIGERLDGAYAVIAVNSRFPNQVVTFRENRPMEYMLIRPLNIVAIASEKKFLEAAIAKYDFFRRMVDNELPALDFVDRLLAEKEFRIFDTNRPFCARSKMEWTSSFEGISFRGEMRPYTKPMLEDWRVPIKTVTTVPAKAYTPPSSTVVLTPDPKVSKATTALPATVLPAPETEVGSIVTAQVKISLSPEEKAGADAMIRAKSLGLAVRYDLLGEISTALGKTDQEIRGLDQVAMANLLAQLHFNFGYAMGTVDSSDRVEDVRKKGREQLGRMEKTSAKQAKAQAHIWEMKCLLQLATALSLCGFGFTERNASIAIKTLVGIPEERRKDILETAKHFFEDSPSQKAIDGAVSKLKEARDRKKSQRAQSTED